MNKNNIIIIILIAIAGFGLYYYTSNSSTNDTEMMENESEKMTEDGLQDNQNDQMEGDDNSNMENKTNENMNDNNSMEKEAMTDFTYNPSENAIEFDISENTEVSYVAQKRFLSKADQEVTGSTNNVNGKGWVDFQDGSGQFEINLDFSDIKSDNTKRDQDVVASLESTAINTVGNLNNLSITNEGTPFDIKVPGELTINNVKKLVVYDVTGRITQGTLQATGTTNINMSDFNVEPPSLINIYTVDDPIELRFTLNAIGVE